MAIKIEASPFQLSTRPNFSLFSIRRLHCLKKVEKSTHIKKCINLELFRKSLPHLDFIKISSFKKNFLKL